LKIPNAKRAIVDINKLRHYCLNPAHPRGKHKAFVFTSALDFSSKDAVTLQRAILEAIKTHEAKSGESDNYGQRYILDFPIAGPKGDVMIRTAWIILCKENIPRLTTCYVL
jgi:hypothetical protein